MLSLSVSADEGLRFLKIVVGRETRLISTISAEESWRWARRGGEIMPALVRLSFLS